ncbi:MAG TPA: carboxynorspermidine decarboxylase, partial [Leptospiraceae bacterium]|nr:carboxynorspermidine decarboxylase [Leptospiraceae bacterium]
MNIKTPYYLIDENRLLKNLKKMETLRGLSGAKTVLALKCFSTWSVFELMKNYMDGTTSSSLYEARLGYEKFGKEVHAYSVAWSEKEILEVRDFSTKILFNSVSQLKRFLPLVKGKNLGLRINPGISHSGYDLADPARKYTRLGVSEISSADEVLQEISGVMFHCNCDNDDYQSFSKILDCISDRYKDLLEKMEWVSLGGGIYFTKDSYPFEEFCEKIRKFSEKFKVQVYLEPGETAITMSGFLITEVLDIVQNEIEIAIVDASVETHMPDLLIYRLDAKMEIPKGGKHRYMIAGRTCLAGDIFGTYDFPEKLKVGDRITVADAAGYTMVKKNWFNGIQMPGIAVQRLDGRIELI